MKSECISVIVPVYNAEKYLVRCIDSIINQTYKQIEIILINDGSTDNSGMICENYKSKDSRIKVIQKNNGGCSSARNIGLKECTGEYLLFVDSDDYLSSTMIEDYYNVLKKEKAEFVVYTQKRSFLKKKYIYKDSRDLLDFLISSSSYPPYIKLFNANIIRDNDVLFNEELKCCEDAPFIREYLLYCNKIAFIGGKNQYHYNTNNPISLSKKGYIDYCNYAEVKLQILNRLLNQISISDDERQAFISYRAVHCMYCSINHYITHFDNQIDHLINKSIYVLNKYVTSLDSLNEYSKWYKKFIMSSSNDTIDIDSIIKFYNKGFVNSNIDKIRFYIRNHI